MYRRCKESTIIRITEENIIPVCFAHTNQKKAGERNENFGQCILVLIMFMLATMAILEVDRQCKAMTSYGGAITASTEYFFDTRLGNR